MKTENIVIFIAFIVGIIVIFSFSGKNSNENAPEAKPAVEQTKSTPQQEDVAKIIEQLTQEKQALAAKVAELEGTVKQYRQIMNAIPSEKFKNVSGTTQNIFDTDVPAEEGPFGTYQSYVPHIKTFIQYAKTHKIPAIKREDLLELIKVSPDIKNVGTASNMNIISFSDGYYVKLLQNLVAIYAPRTCYHIDFSLDGEATCVGKTPQGYQACKALGGIEGQPNSRIPTWIPYKLPKNVFAN